MWKNELTKVYIVLVVIGVWDGFRKNKQISSDNWV